MDLSALLLAVLNNALPGTDMSVIFAAAGFLPVAGSFVDGYEIYQATVNGDYYAVAGGVLFLVAGFTPGGKALLKGAGKVVEAAYDKSGTVVTRIRKKVDATNRTQLFDDLQAGGTKITPENVVDIQKLPDGRTVWLETGNSSAGLRHINRHADEFAQKGISQDQIPDAVFSALQQNNVVGYQGAGTGRPIYEYSFNGQTHNMAVTVGDNGFIVGANPTSLP